jgi:hypothetical protein
MILLVSSVGNHSNRLFQTIHFEAFAKENNLTYLNLTFNDISYLYNKKSITNNNLFVIPIKKILKITNIDVYDFNEDLNDKYSPEYLFLKKNIVLVGGWNFRVENLTLKYKGFFRDLYSVSEETLVKHRANDKFNLSFILSRMCEFDVVVGVHIRRGDYKEWLGGAHYYEDEVYTLAMNKIKRIFFDKKVLFVLFSNEHLNFPLKDEIIISNNVWFIDHHIMSLCDYLVGPPSSFTMWASYISNKTKYYHIQHCRDFPKEISDFVVCNG